MGDVFSVLAPCTQWCFDRGLRDPAERNLRFKDTRNRMQSYINELEPAVRELAQANETLDKPRSETSEFFRLIDKGKALLDECSDPNGNRVKSFLRRSHYVAKMEKLEKSLEKALALQSVRTARDVAESKKLIGLNGAGAGAGAGLKVIGAPCEAPKPPEFTVGFDPAMEDLRRKILEEKDCKVVVLTAPAGHGKTTLAKMLCHDERIRAKFSTILFVTVSETPDLARIVGDLCSRYRFKMPQLRKDEDAIDKLREVLKEIGERPLLLVLDDVWPRSELLIKDFTNLDIPEYKILVTSQSKFPGSGHSYELEELGDEDALALFRHHAISKHVNFDIPVQIVKKVVSQCMKSPLALVLIGASLCGKVQEIWESKSEQWSRSDSSVVMSENKLLNILSRSLELLPEKEKLKESFIDLCSFPEDQRIAATILIDVWTELHCLTEKDAAANLYLLCDRNMAHLVITRSDADEKDGDYSEHFLTPHDMLRQLAIYESNKGGSLTKRLILNLRGKNLPDISKPLDPRLVSITSDGSLPSEWCNIQLPETEVLILNFHAENYKVPEFVKSMTKLKLLILTNQSYFKAQLTSFKLLDSLADLKTIRLEGIDIASLTETHVRLKNLHKLSLVMCQIGQAFSYGAVSELLKGLTELIIHYCNDLTTLPSGLKKLKKLRVTRCHKLSSLPQDIGEMENLEELKLRSCIGLEKLPESICKLSKLNSLDISECFSVRELPERIGDLGRLERLNVKGCSRLQCFPPSILELEGSLKDVACDEDMKDLLESHLTSGTEMTIRVPKEYINLNGL